VFKLYRVTLVQPANATRRRRSMVCAERADVERLIIRGPTEFISSAEVGGPIDNFIANLLANRMPSAKTRESFYGLLKTYLTVRPDLAYALDKSAGQVNNPALGSAICRMQEAMAGGKDLATAIKAHLIRAIPKPDVAALTAAVGVGTPLLAVEKLQQKAKFQVGLRGRVKKAAAYPMIVMFLATGVLTFVATQELPKMVKTLSDFQSTPSGVVVLVFGAGHFIQQYPFITYLPLVLVTAALVFSQRLYTTAFVQRAITLIPPLRRLVFKTAMAQSLFTYAMLARSRVPTIEALQLASEETLSPSIRKFFATTCLRLSQGTPSLFEAAIPNADILGHDGYEFVSLMQAGEQSGNSADIAETVAQAYRRDSEEAVDILTQLINPALLIIVGIMVLAVGIMTLAPIAQLYKDAIPQVLGGARAFGH
jgi:type II secretory pathway component PulF